MTTNQPEWELVANLGDVSFATYGGLLVFRDKTGVYPEEGEYWEAPESDNPKEKGNAFRFILDRCTYQGRVLSDNQFHHDFGTWWDDNLDGISKSCDVPLDKLILRFCSADAIERGFAYQDLGLYFGFDNLDPYPLNLTDAEAQERYKDI